MNLQPSSRARIGFGSALGVVLLVISIVPISVFLYQSFRREEQP